MRDKIRRFGWLALAVLFVVTGVGFGIYAFVVNTHPSSGSSYIACKQVNKVPNQQPGKDGKVAGAKLADYSAPQSFSYLKCDDLKVGTGATATSTSTVTATYTGAVAATGIIFQSSFDTGQPFTAQLSSGVIQGWAAGIPGMKVGGLRRLYIPAQYAYGNQAVAGIPANSDLVFDVQLLSVK